MALGVAARERKVLPALLVWKELEESQGSGERKREVRAVSRCPGDVNKPLKPLQTEGEVTFRSLCCTWYCLLWMTSKLYVLKHLSELSEVIVFKDKAHYCQKMPP